MTPRWPQMAQDGPKIAPRWPKKPPRCPQDADPHHRHPQRPPAHPACPQDGPGLEPLGQPAGPPCLGGVAKTGGRQQQLVPHQLARLADHAQLLTGATFPATDTTIHGKPGHGQRLVDFRGAIQAGKKNFLITKKNFLTTRHISLTLPVSSPLFLTFSVSKNVTRLAFNSERANETFRSGRGIMSDIRKALC